MAHDIAHVSPTGVHRCTCGTHFDRSADFAFHVQTANHTERSHRCRHEAMRVAHQLAPIGVSIGSRPDVDVLGSLPEVMGTRVVYQRPNGQQFELLVTELEAPRDVPKDEIAAAELDQARREGRRGWFGVRWFPISSPDDVYTCECRVDTGLGGWYIVAPLKTSGASWLHPDPVYQPPVHGTFDQMLTPQDEVARAMIAWVKAVNGVR